MTVTDKELTAMREEQLKWMPERGGTLQRKVYLNGENFGWRDVVIDAQVRITAGHGRFNITSDRYTGINPVLITFPFGTDVQAGDRFLHNDLIYEIREAEKPKSYLTAIQCLCDLVS
jgi:head-tail adaptor